MQKRKPLRTFWGLVEASENALQEQRYMLGIALKEVLKLKHKYFNSTQ